jgi:group II intron reverse transcriptase/maturase
MTGKRKWHSLIDKVYLPRNLAAAWKSVRANKGAAGIDRQTIEQFEAREGAELERLHTELKEDRYRPLPVRRVMIPKPDGRERPLGIPAVRDRVVQQALRQVLEPIFESKFLDVSHGFRAKRSIKTALKQVWKQIRQGDRLVLEVDFQSFFDTIDQDLVIDEVAAEVADGRVLSLIRSILRSGVNATGRFEETLTGTPQGGVISPLLSNIVLHQLDVDLTARGYRMVRYADDFVITCKHRREAEEALDQVRSAASVLRLTLHPDKTRIVHVGEGFDFLGYTIKKGYSLYALPRRQKVESFKDKIREITRRNRPVNLRMVIGDLKPVIEGWGQHFARASVKGLFWKLDRWICRRVRAFIAKCTRNQVGRRLPDGVLFRERGLASLWRLYLKART